MSTHPSREFPTLRSARLTLRETTLADAPALLAIHGDADAMRWFGADPITSLAQAEGLVKVFAQWREAPHPGTRWGLELDGRLVGTAGLFKWNPGWRSCTVGFELARDVWGQGLMSEALRAILPWGLDAMALQRVEAQVHPDNAASLRVLTGLGFVREGLQREAGAWCGRRHDLVMLGLLARELNAG